MSVRTLVLEAGRVVAILAPLLAAVAAAAVAPDRVGCAPGVAYCGWWQLLLVLSLVLAGAAGSLGVLGLSVATRRAVR